MKRYPFKQDPERVEETAEKLSEDARLKSFFIEHDVPGEAIEEAVNELLVYTSEIAYCEACPSLSECMLESRGMQPNLFYKRGAISLEYRACEYLQDYLAKRRHRERFQALYMPKMVMEATLEDFYMNTDARKQVYHQIMAVSNAFKKGESVKGIYLHGRYQVGKTYALGAIANRFSDLGFEALLAYYPDLVREIKSSIQTGNLEQRIEDLKHVDILLLDDIGAESYSQWVRDEVLGPILQHRLLDEKPTFFASNVPLKELSKYFIDNNQQQELIKGWRIVERVKRLADEFRMS